MGQMHFKGLVYTLTNEDSLIESELLPNNTKNVITIAGSGSRVIPLLAKSPKHLVCADLSLEQLYLTELRIECVRQFSHEEYIQFFGYPTLNSTIYDREDLFHRLVTLSPAAYHYFLNLFKNNFWKTLLYSGKWEYNVRKFSPFIRKFIGKKGLDILNCKTLEEQRIYYSQHFPHKAWNLFLIIYAVLMNITWKIKPGIFPQVDPKISFYQTYKNCFNAMFLNTLARENYILQLVFWGEIIFPEALPAECNRTVFQKAKSALLQTKVSYVQADIISAIENHPQKVDFVSFSNAPSYFPLELAKNYLSRISSQLSESAILIIRHFLNDPSLTCLTGFQDLSEHYSHVLAKEITKTYAIQILQFK